MELDQLRYFLLREVPFDPLTVLGPGAPEQSAEAFDADLRARNPWIDDVIGSTG